VQSVEEIQGGSQWIVDAEHRVKAGPKLSLSSVFNRIQTLYAVSVGGAGAFEELFPVYCCDRTHNSLYAKDFGHDPRRFADTTDKYNRSQTMAAGRAIGHAPCRVCWTRQFQQATNWGANVPDSFDHLAGFRGDCLGGHHRHR
jgi:hypothetical protein